MRHVKTVLIALSLAGLTSACGSSESTDSDVDAAEAEAAAAAAAKASPYQNGFTVKFADAKAVLDEVSALDTCKTLPMGSLVKWIKTDDKKTRYMTCLGDFKAGATKASGLYVTFGTVEGKTGTNYAGFFSFSKDKEVVSLGLVTLSVFDTVNSVTCAYAAENDIKTVAYTSDKPGFPVEACEALKLSISEETKGQVTPSGADTAYDLTLTAVE